MANIWYLGPWASEEDVYLLIYEIAAHLDRAGASFRVPPRAGVLTTFPAMPRQEAAEAISKVILKADGRDFVPMTRGEYMDRAVSLGLFPRDTDWKSPMTKGDAAVLAAKLFSLQERG